MKSNVGKLKKLVIFILVVGIGFLGIGFLFIWFAECISKCF